MAFCSNCGKELENGVKFCPACGTATAPAAQAAPAAPAAEEVFATVNPTKTELDAMVDEAFGKGLAATICAWFPVASIVAIAQGSKGLKKLAEAKNLAQQYGTSLSGKNIAARILGMVGKIGGIVMTVFYPLYIIILIAALA